VIQQNVRSRPPGGRLGGLHPHQDTLSLYSPCRRSRYGEYEREMFREAPRGYTASPNPSI
jgi:hypothetical protein